MTIVDTDHTRVTGRRIVQYVLDLFLAGVVLGLLGLLANAVAPRSGFRSVPGSLTELYNLTAEPGLPSVVAVVLTVLVWAAVFVVIPHRTGRTPAMALLGLRIVRVDGDRPSVGQHAGRAVLLVLDTLLGGLVGWIVILCSRRRQRIGDHAAGTLVVRA
ncbi:RDD family protein [Pseudonocardia sp. KRD291]|uniref:RDD family protein n=1 Tax=Pseudonocardia sp. KRD291 TaxID=2792007 RepID=UPI001C4A68E7|nr:RDD family protein [Pseudonocardia sp. KRD291]MBW0102706.1 RDD family protein [Pseudonocardia sp. KRD291]